MGDAGAGFPVRMAILAFKVVDEGGPDLVHRPDGMLGEGWLITVIVGHDDDDGLDVTTGDYFLGQIAYGLCSRKE